MKILPFLQSINLRGNRILNAKVNTPQADEEIAPKGYVDKKTIFDTEKSNQFPNGSPKFSWLNFSLKDKTFKQLFDDLFFPIVLPIFIEADYTKVNVITPDEFNNVVVSDSGLMQTNVFFFVKFGDRIVANGAKVSVTDNNDSVTDFAIEEAVVEGENIISFSFIYANIKSIKLVTSFEAVITPKQDNYGNDYISPEFSSNYDLTYDLLNEVILNKYDITLPILSKKLTPQDSITDIINSISNETDLLTLSNFQKSNILYLSADNENVFIFGIPAPLYTHYKIYLNFEETVLPLTKSLVFDLNLTSNRAIKTLDYYGTNNDYLFFSIDLGFHEITKKTNIVLERLRTPIMAQTNELLLANFSGGAEVQTLQDVININKTADRVEFKFDVTKVDRFNSDHWLGLATTKIDPIDPTKTYIYGTFSDVDRKTKTRNIIRLNSDGSVDETFKSEFLLKVVTYGGSDILCSDDGKIYVTGYFTTFGGFARTRIVRLNYDGSVDETFQSNLNGFQFGMGSGLSFDVNKTHVYICGLFQDFNGTPSQSFVKVDLNGVVDASFIIGTGFDNQTIDSLTNADGSVVVVGYFSSYKGVSSPRIIRLLANGTKDSSFNVGVGINSASTTKYIFRNREGVMICYGNFTKYNNITVNHIVAINEDGSINTNYNFGVGFSKQIHQIKQLANGKYLIDCQSAITYQGITSEYGTFLLNEDFSVFKVLSVQFPFMLGSDLYGAQHHAEDGTYFKMLRLDSDYTPISKKSLTFDETTGKAEYRIGGLTDTSADELLPKRLVSEMIQNSIAEIPEPENVLEVTKSELDVLITNSLLVAGLIYKISGVHPTLYNDGTNSGTTIYLRALTTNTLSSDGHGEFWNPKYNQNEDGFGIWSNRCSWNLTLISGVFSADEMVTGDGGQKAKLFGTSETKLFVATSGDWSTATSIVGDVSAATATVSGVFVQTYAIGDKVIWGGYSWTNINGLLGSSSDVLNLNAEWSKNIYDVLDYNKVFDSILYDYSLDEVTQRHEITPNNKVTTNEITNYVFRWDEDFEYNPISVFMFGNFNGYEARGVYDNCITLSYFENINFAGYSVYGNTLNGGSLFYDNIFVKGSTISFNKLVEQSRVYSNIGVSGLLQSNDLNDNCGIYQNYLINGFGTPNICRNILKYYSDIRSNIIVQSSIGDNIITSGRIDSNTMRNNSNISMNTNETSYVSSNTLVYSNIDRNKLRKGAFLSSNTLSYSNMSDNYLTGVVVRFNILSAAADISYNKIFSGGIQTNTMDASKIIRNEIKGGGISSNNITNNSFIHENEINGYIDTNTLTTSSNIGNNTITKGAVINKNNLTSSQISYNTTIGGGINSNILNNGGTISSNISNFSQIDYNEITVSFVTANEFLNSFMQYNKLISNTIFQKNTFNNSTFQVGVAFPITTKNLKFLAMDSGVLDVDITSAGILYNPHQKTIYSRPDGVAKLRYYNNFDTLVIADIAEPT